MYYVCITYIIYVLHIYICIYISVNLSPTSTGSATAIAEVAALFLLFLSPIFFLSIRYKYASASVFLVPYAEHTLS